MTFQEGTCSVCKQCSKLYHYRMICMILLLCSTQYHRPHNYCLCQGKGLHLGRCSEDYCHAGLIHSDIRGTLCLFNSSNAALCMIRIDSKSSRRVEDQYIHIFQSCYWKSFQLDIACMSSLLGPKRKDLHKDGSCCWHQHNIDRGKRKPLHTGRISLALGNLSIPLLYCPNISDWSRRHKLQQYRYMV